MRGGFERRALPGVVRGSGLVMRKEVYLFCDRAFQRRRSVGALLFSNGQVEGFQNHLQSDVSRSSLWIHGKYSFGRKQVTSLHHRPRPLPEAPMDCGALPGLGEKIPSPAHPSPSPPDHPPRAQTTMASDPTGRGPVGSRGRIRLLTVSNQTPPRRRAPSTSSCSRGGWRSRRWPATTPRPFPRRPIARL